MDDLGPEKCAGCQKIVFPPEKLICLKQTWHKWCLKCTTCKATLSVKTIESWENKPYCRAHMQTAKMGGGVKTMHEATGVGEIVTKETKVQGTDQSVENRPDKLIGETITYEARGGDQSTENRPESSTIKYEVRGGDQSTENRPESSSIKYEVRGGDQSTENRPGTSGITYESHSADQSTENAPHKSSVTYESHSADQSTESAHTGASSGGASGEGEETVALYDFEGTEGGEQELTFSAGAKLWVTDKSDPDGYYYGYDENNNEGYFPGNYTEMGAE